MKFLRFASLLACTSLLAACGGGGGSAGTSPFNTGGGTTTTSAAAIDVIASSVQLGSGGDQVTITAIVKGAGNVSLPATAVSFATDSGTLTSASALTDASGVATATLSAGADRSNRSITVTVTSGNASGTVVLPVSGTTLSYTGASTLGFGRTSPLSIKIVDSKGTSVSGVAVTVSSSLNNALSATSVTTDAQGTAAVNYTATNAGNDRVTFTGGGVTTVVPIQVSADNFSFVDGANAPFGAGMQIPVGTSQPLTVRYLVGNVPQANKSVLFTSTAGVVAPTGPVITDVNGRATVNVLSNTASPATVQATVTSPGSTAQTTIPVLFVALAPAKVVLQVSPTAIGPNQGTATTQQAQLLATVTDANANPVANATVNFSRVTDPSGGNLSQPSAVTDSSGQASVQFIAGGTTTASNGVQVKAQVAGTAVSGLANLTVNQSALFIALGTGNVISNLDPQTYKKDWVVYVTDANGIAVPNINLTIKILPVTYGKGTLSFVGGAWVYTPGGALFCPNEDDGAGNANNAYNGILDPGEDRNGNGRLEPGNVISVTASGLTGGASSGTVKTDVTGRATISLIYAESYAPWVKVRLRAEAVVTGTESSKEAVFTVSGAAEDFTSATVPPAGAVSPFGTVLDCANPN